MQDKYTPERQEKVTSRRPRSSCEKRDGAATTNISRNISIDFSCQNNIEANVGVNRLSASHVKKK
jgi:hypothetical protein